MIIKKIEKFFNIINYVLCDLYACKNHLIKYLWFLMRDLYLRRKYKIEYLSKHYFSKMDRKYDMDFFENRISFMLLMMISIPAVLFLSKLLCYIFHLKILYIFYTLQFFITLLFFKFVFYKKKSKYKFEVFDRIKLKYIFRWRCITFCIIFFDILLCVLMML